MPDNDLKDAALSSKEDFYELLGVEPTANDSEVRRAYRKTALKYHPDKVGADQAALDKFHLLQIAYDVLSDTNVRQLYDNARRARNEKKERDAAYDGRRRALKEELEAREKAGVQSARNEVAEEEAFQRELNRLAADGARRRKEREEQLRQEAREEFEREQREDAEVQAKPAERHGAVSEMDRTISLRYPARMLLNREDLRDRFGKFGSIQDVVLGTKLKKIKVEGEKHRREYATAIIVFENMWNAHAAVTDIAGLARADPDWTIFEDVNWASGKAPDAIPKAPARSAPTLQSSTEDYKAKAAANRAAFQKGLNAPPLAGVPSFQSFARAKEHANAVR